MDGTFILRGKTNARQNKLYNFQNYSARQIYYKSDIITKQTDIQRRYNVLREDHQDQFPTPRTNHEAPRLNG